MEIDQLVEACRQEGLRITKGLRLLLSIFQKTPLPLSLHDLESNETLSSQVDRATIFRSLQRLENIGLLRKLNFANRRAKYSLHTGSHHQEYLICRECGKIEVLDIACPIHSLEEQVSEQTGFQNLQHELTFYGICKSCS